MQYLKELTRHDLAALAEYAERRMDWLPRAQSTGEDAVHKALLSILRGIGRGAEGRRPRMSNLRTKADFMHYIRSAINSGVEAAKRKRELWVFHETLHRERGIDEEQTFIFLTARLSAAEDVCMLDLKQELFARMRKTAAPDLLPMINEWEKSFLWDTDLPSWKNRRHRDQVRHLAIRILRQIASDFGR